MASTRKSFGDNLNIVLYSEVNGICPKCERLLMYEKKGVPHKAYEIAHIYPLKPTPTEITLLEKEERLSDDVNHEDNLIPLCKECHVKFDKPRTVEEYRELVQIKKNLQKQVRERNIWHQHSLESDIQHIIESLCNIEYTEDMPPLSYEPKTVDDKADSSLTNVTKRNVKNNVSEYFSFIKDKLRSIELESPNASGLISTQIKLCYLSLEKEGLTQQEIYNNLVNWVNAKTNMISKDACDIIVSFFIQNCEVFE